MTKTIHTYSFIFIGSMESGKSTLFDTLVNQQNNCQTISTPTVTSRYEIVDFEIENNIYRLEILDTPGMKLSQSLSNVYFSTTSCVCLFVDLTQQSYKKQIKIIFNKLQKIQDSYSSSFGMTSSSGSSDECRFGFPMAVIGTKGDLVSDKQKEQFEEEMSSFGLPSFVCDCLNIHSVNDIFNDLLDLDYVHPQTVTTLSIEKKNKKKKQKRNSGCCIV